MNKTENVANAIAMIRKAYKEHRPHLIVLPECFNGPYMPKYFDEFAEIVPNGPTSIELSKVAKELSVHIIGSIMERESDTSKTLYNTATVWTPEGKLLDKHRKLHLYEANFKDFQFKEASALTPGNKFTMFNIGPAKIGLGICFDIHFEEMARIYRNQGCNFLVYPAAYTIKAGLLYWENVGKARAMDTQCYIGMVSGAKDVQNEYVQYGYTMFVDPWGKIVKTAQEKEEIVVHDLGK